MKILSRVAVRGEGDVAGGWRLVGVPTESELSYPPHWWMIIYSQ